MIQETVKNNFNIQTTNKQFVMMEKLLIYVCLLGASMWIASEVAEMLSNGFSSVSLSINIFAFTFLAIGWWGLDHIQTTGNSMSWFGTIGLSAAFLIFTVISLQMFQTGNTQGAELSMLYMVGIAAMIVGGILFGSSILKLDYFPKWTGILMILLIVVSLSGIALELPGIVQNISNILLSCTLIYMCFFGLNSLNVSMNKIS